MTQAEFEKLLSGDRVKVQWAPNGKVYDVIVLETRSYDNDPEPETAYCVGKSISGEFIASQITFVSHNPKIQALIDKIQELTDKQTLIKDSIDLKEYKDFADKYWDAIVAVHKIVGEFID